MMFASLTMCVCVYPSLDFARHFLDERMNEQFMFSLTNNTIHEKERFFRTFIRLDAKIAKLSKNKISRAAITSRCVFFSFSFSNFFFPFSIRYSFLG